MPADSWLCQKVEDIDERLQRLEFAADRLNINVGQHATLKGGNWEVSEKQIAQWVPGTVLPLGASSEYVRFKDGNLEIRGGQFDIHTGESGARMQMDGSGMYAWNGGGTQTFALDFTTGDLTIRGTIYASAGQIAGWSISSFTIKRQDGDYGIELSSGFPHIAVGNLETGPYIYIDGANGRIGVSDYVSGASGWRIEENGDAEFNNIVARGVIHTPVFLKEEVAAIGGTFLVQESDVLTSDATTAAALDGSFTFECEHNYFAVDDYVRCKPDGTKEFWALITGVAGTGPYTYTATLKSGDTSTTFEKGLAVVNYGPSGAGSVLMTGTLTNAPYVSIFTHAGSPWSSVTERVRLGKLAGITDPKFGALSGYGLWTDRGYFTGSLKATAGELGSLDVAGTLDVGTDGVIKSGATGYDAGTGWWLDYNGGTPRLFIGDATGNKLTWDGTNLAISGVFYITDKFRINANGVYIESTTEAAAVLRFTSDADNPGSGEDRAIVWQHSAGAYNSLSLQAQGTDSYNQAILNLYAQNNTGSLYWQIELNTDGDLFRINRNGTEFAAIDNNGDLYLSQGGIFTYGTSSLFNVDGLDYDFHVKGLSDDYLLFVNAGADKVGIGTWNPAEKLDVQGGIHYTGELKPYRNATAYTGAVFVQLSSRLTSTNFDGDSFSTTAATAVDLSSEFGVPAGVKAILARVLARDSAAWGTGNLYFSLGPTTTQWDWAAIRPFGGDLWSEATLVVPCDSNGDCAYKAGASGANTMDVYWQIIGYWI